MKKITHILIILFLFAGFSITAQDKKGSHDKIKALKVAYLTEQLELSPDEAAKFWPIYNKYDKKLMELRFSEGIRIKNEVKELGGVDALNDKQAKEITKDFLALDETTHETMTEFSKELLKVLSYKKFLKLKEAENDFKRKLIKRLRGERKKDR